MDNFIVSARKYRPATFNTVVGQSHITNTLKNAIKTGHLAQAFLFCGPRGVGKTTCARILAKTINCTHRTEVIEACDSCDSCKSFNEGASLNVFELDAASNNSVDDIRNLVDQVRFAPQIGTHKIYIIDEVHMLSTAAFNAFLKTLEEPPRHAIFILATTEKHKIIPTILSRCQIFDFNRIQIDDIAHHLAFIAKSENIIAETDALHIIAQKADGALRDACSIFDQIVSFAGNSVTYKAVIENLNILDYDYYFRVADTIFSQNIPQALLIFNEILNNGFDGHNFIAGLGDHFRNLLVCHDAETIQLLEVGNNIKEKYKNQASKSTLLFLVKALTILNKTDVSYKASKNQRLQVELSLMQLCSLTSSSTEAEKKNDIILPPAKKTTSATFSKSKEQITKPILAQIKDEKEIQTLAKTIDNSEKASSLEKNNTIVEPKPTITAVDPKQNKFTQSELELAWNTYILQLKQRGKTSLSIGLSSNKPMLNADFIVDFVVNNKAVEESINDDKMTFLSFLRNELKNNLVQINLRLSASTDKKRIYTATDRYKYLAEKNPHLNKLRQIFDLDLEF